MFVKKLPKRYLHDDDGSQLFAENEMHAAYIGIIINQYKDPVINQPVAQMTCMKCILGYPVADSQISFLYITFSEKTVFFRP